MDSSREDSWSQWFHTNNPFRASETTPKKRKIYESNPTLFESSPAHVHSRRSRIAISKLSIVENKSLEKHAQDFLRELMKGNALKQEMTVDMGESQARDHEKASQKEDSKTSMWEQFVSGPTNPCRCFLAIFFLLLVIHSQQNSHKSSMSKLLSSKYKASSGESVTPAPSTKADATSECTSISKYWSKEKEAPPTATSDSSNSLTYYQQQSNYLEGGVTITGKAPSKTERKSHQKELAKERKNLMKEVKVDSAESSPNSEMKLKEEGDAKKSVSRRKTEENAEKSSSAKKTHRKQNEEKKSSTKRSDKNAQEESKKTRSKRGTKREQRADATKNGSEGRKRRQKEPIRYRWSWDIHLQQYFSQARILRVGDLGALTHSFQVAYGKPLESEANLMEVHKACLATCVFCFLLNDSTNTFQPSQTVHTDIVNHNYPIAFYFTLYLPDGESSFVLPLAGDVDLEDSMDSEETMMPVIDFFRTFLSLPRLLKITFGFQRFLRLLDFYVQRHGCKRILDADLCSRSCMDALLLAWILDSDYQGILEDRNLADSSTKRDTPEMDSTRLQEPYRTYESVWSAVEKESLDPNALWSNETPEVYLQTLVRGVKQMHVSVALFLNCRKTWSE